MGLKGILGRILPFLLKKYCLRTLREKVSVSFINCVLSNFLGVGINFRPWAKSFRSVSESLWLERFMMLPSS